MTNETDVEALRRELEHYRQEVLRLSSRKQADLDALKERCGRMLATINAHIRLRDEQAAEIARLNAEIHELDAQRRHDETLLVALKQGIDRYRQEAEHQRQQAHLWAERGAAYAAERDEARTRINTALELIPIGVCGSNDELLAALSGQPVAGVRDQVPALE